MTEIAFSRLIAALRIVLLGVIAAAAVIAACALGKSANDAKPLYLTKSQAAEYLGRLSTFLSSVMIHSAILFKTGSCRREQNKDKTGRIHILPILFCLENLMCHEYNREK